MSDAPCRTDLGPLTKKLLEQQQEIDRLRSELQNAYDLTKTLTAERDGARRMYCEEVVAHGRTRYKHVPIHGEEADIHDVAGLHKWDCFKEEGK